MIATHSGQLGAMADHFIGRQTDDCVIRRPLGCASAIAVPAAIRFSRRRFDHHIGADSNRARQQGQGKEQGAHGMSPSDNVAVGSLTARSLDVQYKLAADAERFGWPIRSASVGQIITP